MISSLRNIARVAPTAYKGLVAPTAIQFAELNQVRAQSGCPNGVSCKHRGSCGCIQDIRRGITTNNVDSNTAPQSNVQYNAPVYGTVEENLSYINRAEEKDSSLLISFYDGEKNEYPMVWLRDNCQCHSCFDPQAWGRSFLMTDFDISVKPQSVAITKTGDLCIQWEDGHQSQYNAAWLQERAFTEQARQKYRTKYNLQKAFWSTGYNPAKYDYELLMKEDKELLKWLIQQETYGATVIENVPAKPPAAYEFCERIAKAKYTHFGDYSNVVNNPGKVNNLAYSNKKLNLHNDMPQYSEIPGLILLHMIKQHEGKGGDTIISDGFNAAEQMRLRYPEEFELLCTTDVYFWDKGGAKDSTQTEFYKINRGTTIQRDNNGIVTTIRFNNQVRDSHLDLPPHNVPKFYNALKIYCNLMYANSIRYKMSNGQMTVLDNVRCQHAREGFDGDDTGRHLVTTFMAWDEALCRRRRLQEKLTI